MAGRKGQKSANATSYGAEQGNTPKGDNPKRPGPGASPEMFRRKMQLIASRAKTVANVEKLLEAPNHPNFMRALEFAADRGYGKAPSSVDVTTNGQSINGLLVIPPET